MTRRSFNEGTGSRGMPTQLQGRHGERVARWGWVAKAAGGSEGLGYAKDAAAGGRTRLASVARRGGLGWRREGDCKGGGGQGVRPGRGTAGHRGHRGARDAEATTLTDTVRRGWHADTAARGRHLQVFSQAFTLTKGQMERHRAIAADAAGARAVAKVRDMHELPLRLQRLADTAAALQSHASAQGQS
ncbi:hypothetical protein ERJ75_000308000 [Trypanosoma vivax]|nr:hypothetical protein ERJ75_000308000 [Trypanosoma vivax]